jgi:hypothetical protein
MERGRRGNLLAFGMQDREAAGAPLRAEHARTDTTASQASPSDPCGMVPSSAMGGRSDKHPMALEGAQASVPSRACPSPGRRGPIPAATSNTCADLWTFRSGRDQGPTGRRGASWPKWGFEPKASVSRLRSRTHRAWRALHSSEGGRRDTPRIGVLSQSEPSQSEPSQSACNSGETRHTLANARRKGLRDARLSDQSRVIGDAGQMESKRGAGQHRMRVLGQGIFLGRASVQGPTTAAAPFTRFNNLRSKHSTAGKQPRRGPRSSLTQSFLARGKQPVSSHSVLAPRVRLGAGPLSRSVAPGSPVRMGAITDQRRCVALDGVDAPAPGDTKVTISDEVEYANYSHSGVEHVGA